MNIKINQQVIILQYSGFVDIYIYDSYVSIPHNKHWNHQLGGFGHGPILELQLDLMIGENNVWMRCRNTIR